MGINDYFETIPGEIEIEPCFAGNAYSRDMILFLCIKESIYQSNYYEPTVIDPKKMVVLPEWEKRLIDIFQSLKMNTGQIVPQWWMIPSFG